MHHSIRTQGDGTEYPEIVTESSRKVSRSSPDDNQVNKLARKYLSKKIQSSSSLLYNSSENQETVINFPREVKPNGKKFYLIPKLIPKSGEFHLKNKTPKLILMEPYKACVSPIIPFKESNNKIRKSKIIDKNNLDLNELVRHMNITKTSLILNDGDNYSIKSGSVCGGDEYAQLKKERDLFEAQLKFQMQVNSELKGLLVHCLGEDIQSKVSNLTEDKMKIAEHLSSNTEKIEYLAGQVEVWRSKFLASSLMVEELAKWKAVLTEKNQHLSSSNKKLLETFAMLRDMEIELYQNLKFIAGYHETNLQTSNVIDLTAECLNLSQQLVLNSGKIGLPEQLVSNLDPLTDAQKQAIEVQDTSNFLTSTDEAFKAICNQANQEYNRVRTQSERSFEIVDPKDTN